MRLPALPDDWRHARWWRGRLKVRFVGKTPKPRAAGQQGLFHPSFVGQALIYEATPEDTPSSEKSGWQRPVLSWRYAGVDAYLQRFISGTEHELEIILPYATGPETRRRLRERLSPQPLEHFHVVAISELEVRNLDLLQAASPVPEGLSWLELRFHTPFTFRAPQPARSWQPNWANLGRAIVDAGRLFLGGPDLTTHAWPTDTPLNAAFWSLCRLSHRSSSRGGVPRSASGFHGPLYLRLPPEELPQVWPWLLLGAEFHIGKDRALGFGCFTPGPPRPLLDPALLDPEHLRRTWQAVSEGVDPVVRGEPFCLPGQEEQALTRLQASLGDCTWQASPGDLVGLPKGTHRLQALPDAPEEGEETPDTASTPKERYITLLPERDQVAQRAALELLRHPVERLYADALHSYRRGRSVATALRQARAYLQQGRSWVVKLDVAAFFDEIPWTPMLERLTDAFPAADPALHHLLHQTLTSPVHWQGGLLRRSQGILQGSPLSPLFSNLYLTPFDHALTAAGITHLRYGDDIALFCPNAEAARAALAEATRLLETAGLRLSEGKTRIVDTIAEALPWLGSQLGGPEGPPSEPDAPSLHRPVYLSAPHQWAGCEGGALTLREGTHLAGRLPLSHASEIHLCGLGGLSTRLIAECHNRGLVLQISDGIERPLATLAPCPRTALDGVIAHHAAFTALSEAERLAAAARVVEAKLAAYEIWLRSLRDAPDLRKPLRHLVVARGRLTSQPDADALRGVEGECARLLFPLLNERLKDPFFHSRHRVPRDKTDPWNTLLDTGYHLLFQRLHNLLCAAHLHPYLGFLHSAQNRYPSLVCDLQEPFRARIDRLLIRLVNLAQIHPGHFEKRPDGRWRLLAPGARILIREFEIELDRHHHEERTCWRALLDLQTQALRRWALHRSPLWLYSPLDTARLNHSDDLTKS